MSQTLAPITGIEKFGSDSRNGGPTYIAPSSSVGTGPILKDSSDATYEAIGWVSDTYPNIGSYVYVPFDNAVDAANVDPAQIQWSVRVAASWSGSTGSSVSSPVLQTFVTDTHNFWFEHDIALTVDGQFYTYTGTYDSTDESFNSLSLDQLKTLITSGNAQMFFEPNASIAGSGLLEVHISEFHLTTTGTPNPPAAPNPTQMLYPIAGTEASTNQWWASQNTGPNYFAPDPMVVGAAGLLSDGSDSTYADTAFIEDSVSDTSSSSYFWAAVQANIQPLVAPDSVDETKINWHVRASLTFESVTGHTTDPAQLSIALTNPSGSWQMQTYVDAVADGQFYDYHGTFNATDVANSGVTLPQLKHYLTLPDTLLVVQPQPNINSNGTRVRAKMEGKFSEAHLSTGDISADKGWSSSTFTPETHVNGVVPKAYTGTVPTDKLYLGDLRVL